MRVNFKKIEIRNFMSFENEVFEFDSHIGMNLVCGKNNDIPGSKNGSGKSTLFSALCFALFGETQNKIKNENVHNRFVEDADVRVVVYFDIDNINYKIVSGLNKRNQAYCSLTRFDDDNNEVDLTKSSILETRRFIEKEILHFDMPIFLRTILLSSDQNYNFYRLKKWEKKEFIEKLFDISIFGQMFDSIHKDTLSLDKSISSSQDKLVVLNRNADEYNSQIDQYNKKHEDDLNKLKDSISKLESEREILKNTNVKNNSDEVSKYEDASNKITDKLNKLQIAQTECKNKLHKIDLNLHKLETSKDNKQKLIDKYSDILSKLCEDCSKIFKDYYSIGQIQDDIKLIDEKQTDLNSSKTIIQEKSKQYEDASKTLQTKYELIQNKITDLTKEYNAINSKILVLESRIESYNSQYEQKNSESNPYVSLLNKNKISIDSETKTLEELSDKYRYLKFAENIVSQDTLRKFIISDLIGLLNNKIKTYLTKLGANYNVVFDEDMNYQFQTPGGTCEYDSFSSGEKMRICIATSFSFRDFLAIRSSFSSNILILDEYIDSNLDTQSVENVLDILKDFIILYKQNIFIISHRKEIDNSIFNNIIQIQKTNNISKIVELEI